MTTSANDFEKPTRKKTSPIQLGLTIVLAAIMASLVAAGFLFGDDVDDLFDGEDRLVERVQIQGYWMGMKLGPADESAVGSSGVTVLDISETYGWLDRQAGILTGDVLMSVNGKKVSTLSELDAAAKKTSSASGLPVELQRWGQPLSVVIPPMAKIQQPMQPPPPVGPAAVPAQPGTPAVWAAPYIQPAAAAPAAVPQNPGAGAGMFYCPQHRVTFSQQHVHPHYRCPIGGGPLSRAQ